MRIPRSAIVMSLVTAVPFGLAVRDTLRPHVTDEDAGFDFDGSKARARAEREYERRMADEATAAAEEATAKLARMNALIDALHELYGTAPASPGTLFAGIELGAPSGSFQPEAARARIEKFRTDHDVRIAFDMDEIALTEIKVTVPASACHALQTRLTTAWGAGATRTAGTDRFWFDHTAHRRAILVTEDECALTFQLVHANEPYAIGEKD